MKKRPFVLRDLEDLALAACDDMYLDAPIARGILSTWYERDVSLAELRVAYARLIQLGLLRAYAKRDGRIRSVSLVGTRSRTLLVKATGKGRQYLGWKRHVV